MSRAGEAAYRERLRRWPYRCMQLEYTADEEYDGRERRKRQWKKRHPRTLSWRRLSQEFMDAIKVDPPS